MKHAFRVSLAVIVLAACSPVTDPPVAMPAETEQGSGGSAFSQAQEGLTRIAGDCGRLGDFRSQAWYLDVLTAVQAAKPAAGSFSEACLEKDGTTLIVAADVAGMCASSAVYRVDLSRRPLALDTVPVDNRTYFTVDPPQDECSRNLDPHGVIMQIQGMRRQGDGVITLSGSVGFGGCSKQVYYDYDLVRNSIVLKKTLSHCEAGFGEPDRWQEY